MPSLDLLLLIGAVVALVAIFAARLGSTFGLPSLLLFLALGMAIGDSGLGVRFSDAELAHSLGFAALVVILAEGGLTTKWENIRGSIKPAGALATIGIAASIGLMALFGHYVLSLSWSVAFLLGAITAPTDSAAVFSVLRGLPLPASVRATLEAESGLNDATINTVGASLRPDSASSVARTLDGRGSPRRTEKTAAESVGAVIAPSRKDTDHDSDKT